MSEVYRAMKALDLEWMIMNPYHVLVSLFLKVCQNFVCPLASRHLSFFMPIFLRVSPFKSLEVRILV